MPTGLRNGLALLAAGACALTFVVPVAPARAAEETKENPATVTNVFRFPAEYSLGQVEVTPDGATLFQLAGTDPKKPEVTHLIAVDVASGAQLWQTECEECFITAMPDSQSVLVKEGDSSFVRLKAATGVEIGRLESETPVTNPLLSLDGSTTYFGTDYALVEANTDTHAVTRIYSEDEDAQSGAATPTDQDGERDVQSGKLSDEEKSRQMANTPFPVSMVSLSDSVLAYDGPTNNLMVVSPAKKKVLRKGELPKAPAGGRLRLFIDSNFGEKIAVGYDRTDEPIKIISTSSLTVTGQVGFNAPTIPLGLGTLDDRVVALIAKDGYWQVQSRAISDGRVLGTAKTDVEIGRDAKETWLWTMGIADAAFVSDATTRTVWKISGGDVFAPIEDAMSGDSDSQSGESAQSAAEDEAAEESPSQGTPLWARGLLGVIVVVGVIGAFVAAKTMEKRRS